MRCLFGHKYKFVLDDEMNGLVQCERCKQKMFGEHIGVILIYKKYPMDLHSGHSMLCYEPRKGDGCLKPGTLLVFNENGNVEQAR